MTSKQILVVDDEIGIRELLLEILFDEGYVVHLAENAEQIRQVAVEVSDRIGVMYAGELVKVLDASEASEHELGDFDARHGVILCWFVNVYPLHLLTESLAGDTTARIQGYV